MARGECTKYKTVRVTGYSHKVCAKYAGSGSPKRGRKAKKAYCVKGTTHKYGSKCGCKTRGGGFTFLPKSRCR